ncbi:MAG: DNA repair protein RecO, partial [Clostridia bacterium]|nr:DNA repair protein RecO [Clostridia bacterium]
MDIITKAIALRTTDYGESDKFILLYSLEHGKISVHAKGIRKAKAKLKFAGDTFCFGNYELAQTGQRLVLKTCEQLESFYTLREDIVTYYAACAIAECIVNYTEEGQSEPQLFVETLRALEQLVLGTNPLTVVLRYLLGFVKSQGFALDFKRCYECGVNAKKMFLDFAKGGIV